MKKIYSLLLLVTFLISSSIVNAQETTTVLLPDYDHKVEISPLVGYMLNGRVNFIDGDIQFENMIDYGINLAFNVNYGIFAELSYTYSPSVAKFRSYRVGVPDQQFDIAIHYIQIGGVKEFMPGRIRPYGTLTLGASGFVPVNSFYESWWSFAVGLGLGVKINISEHIAIRLQGRMLLPLRYSGIGIFCGPGGCGGGLTATSALIQGDFSGGLIFGF